MERSEINNIIRNILPELQKLSSVKDIATKNEICNALYMQSGIKDYGEFQLILEILEALNKDNKDKLIIPKLEEVFVDGIDDSVDDLIRKQGLSWYNVHSCIDTLAGNKIPVLVGLAGAGKTYTADNISEIIFKYKEECGNKFEKMYKVKIPCSNISHNDFWGSFDAVSHICVGKFKYIWQLAEENIDTLYYVILDELLDMYDIRKTFGDSFSMLTNLPTNLVVIGTGNKDVFDVSNETARNMLKDSGILGRFNLIEVMNILQDVDSDSFNYFFNTVIKSSTPLEEHIKSFILNLVTQPQFKDKMLVPRNVIDFIKRGFQCISEEDFKELIKSYIKQDCNYITKALFVNKPVVLDNVDNSLDLFEVLWNA